MCCTCICVGELAASLAVYVHTRMPTLVFPGRARSLQAYSIHVHVFLLSDVRLHHTNSGQSFGVCVSFGFPKSKFSVCQVELKSVFEGWVFD